MRRLARGTISGTGNVSAGPSTWTTVVTTSLSLIGGTSLELDVEVAADVAIGGAMRIQLDSTTLVERTFRAGTDVLRAMVAPSIPRTVSPTTYTVRLQVTGEGLLSQVTCNAASNPRHRATIRYNEHKQFT